MATEPLLARPRRSHPGAAPKPLLISDAEVAALLGVARSTVWRWLDAGLIPAPRRLGGRTLWALRDVELFSRCRSLAEFERLRRSEVSRPA